MRTASIAPGSYGHLMTFELPNQRRFQCVLVTKSKEIDVEKWNEFVNSHEEIRNAGTKWVLINHLTLKA